MPTLLVCACVHVHVYCRCWQVFLVHELFKKKTKKKPVSPRVLTLNQGWLGASFYRPLHCTHNTQRSPLKSLLRMDTQTCTCAHLLWSRSFLFLFLWCFYSNGTKAQKWGNWSRRIKSTLSKSLSHSAWWDIYTISTAEIGMNDYSNSCMWRNDEQIITLIMEWV